MPTRYRPMPDHLPHLGFHPRRAGRRGQMHFHDLRHTGNMLAADAGANPRELMERMGQAAEQLGRSTTKPSGTQRAQRRRSAS